MTGPAPLRPCPTCRRPCPDGLCPRHPRSKGGYRPGRPDVVARRRTRALFAAMLASGPLCAYCREAAATTVDHVHPLSRKDIPRDPLLPRYLPACRACNAGKGQRTLAEWVATGRAPVGACEIRRLCVRRRGHEIER